MRNTLQINTEPVTEIDLTSIGHVERYTKRQEEVSRLSFSGFYNQNYISKYRNIYIFEYSYISDTTTIDTLFQYIKDHYQLTLTDDTNSEVVMLTDLPWNYIKNKTILPKITLTFTGVSLTDTVTLL